MTVLSRILATLTATALVGAGLAVGTASAQPALCDVPFTGSAGLGYSCAEDGDLLDVPIGDVRATQPSVGYDQIYYKLGRYTLGKDKINKKFDDWCEANGQEEAASATPDARLDNPASFECTVALGHETPDSLAAMKTVVVGPGGALYLTDGHHTLTSFYETPDGGPNMHVRLRVVANFSALSTPDFWNVMKQNQWVWTRDVDGNEVQTSNLPSGVGLANFADDRYRSMMYFARDIGNTAGTIPFQEFYWGAWLRENNIATWDANDASSYLAGVHQVTRAQVALPKASVVDSGKTAAELGVLDAWDSEGEFAKLSRPYSDSKPGKIAYSLEYKRGL